jgi:hypothetical protein
VDGPLYWRAKAKTISTPAFSAGPYVLENNATTTALDRLAHLFVLENRAPIAPTSGPLCANAVIPQLLSELAKSTARVVKQGRRAELFLCFAGSYFACFANAMSRVICRAAFRGRHGRHHLAPSLGLERRDAAFRDNLIDMDAVAS